MKRWYAGWAAAGVVVLLVCALGAMQQPRQAGRYQVVIGEWTLVADGGQAKNLGVVVRIDTDTGHSDRMSFDDKTGRHRWLPIDDVRVEDLR
jgi:hypothetical protein